MTPLAEIPRAEEFVQLLRDRLDDETARHALSVAEMMRAIVETDGRLGTAPGVSVRAAVWAGLLHDLYKADAPAELLEQAAAYSIAVTAHQRAKPALLHGPVAAEYARRELGVADEAVLEAICWHTTGRPGLGVLGRILYFADFAEPLRTIPQAAEARARLAAEGFERALDFVVRKKCEYLRRRPDRDPTTEAFCAWLSGEQGAAR